MTDIKPDTSLYTDLPSRLRAMALVLEGPSSRLQRKSSCIGWATALSSWDMSRRVAEAVSGVGDYRLKPAPPARLYVDITDDGRPSHTYDLPVAPMPGTTRFTYVLGNPNEND